MCEIFNPDNKPYNIDDSTRPLFEALIQGKTIKSLTMVRGSMNRDKPDLDFTVTNFTCVMYCVSAGQTGAGVNIDMFEITPGQEIPHSNELRSDFYMSNVRSYEL